MQVIELLDNLDIKFVRRAGRRCLRTMDAYRKGLEGPLLDFALKVYSSHRKIANDPAELQKLIVDFETKQKKNTKK